MNLIEAGFRFLAQFRQLHQQLLANFYRSIPARNLNIQTNRTTFEAKELETGDGKFHFFAFISTVHFVRAAKCCVLPDRADKIVLCSAKIMCFFGI